MAAQQLLPTSASVARPSVALPSSHSSANVWPARVNTSLISLASFRGAPRLLHHPIHHCRQPTLSTVTTKASAAFAGDLATYSFNRPVLPPAAPWFQAAIKEVVRHLESSPFLQLVRFAGGDVGTAPNFSSFSVPDCVVAAPELWSSIAEAVTADSADVVILVQRVDPHGAALPAASNAEESAVQARVEAACRKLVASGVGKSIFQGKVGECCDSAAKQRGSIVPFANRAPAARSGVKVKALPEGGGSGTPPAPLSGYWGVVVQSKSHRCAVEGCYLLRAVRQVCPDGCSCTHFSLTRVCQGEHLEKQFISSWLV